MNWKVIDNKLVKTYKMPNFMTIVENINELAAYAEKENHHPDFTVFEYNKIRFAIFSHEQNSVTAADYKMAEFIDSLFG